MLFPIVPNPAIWGFGATASARSQPSGQLRRSGVDEGIAMLMDEVIELEQRHALVVVLKLEL